MLSIVIPSHNGLPWIKDCLESITKQSFTDWEIIIRDDGSTDGTREWLSRLDDPRIKVILAGKSRNVAENWTEVSKLATGKFTKIVCQDDLLLGDCLEQQVRALLGNPTLVMVASRHQVIDSSGKVLMTKHGLAGLIGTMSGAKAFIKSVSKGANSFGEPVSTMFRTSALTAALPFDPEYPYLTDLDMYRKILQYGDFAGLSEVHAAFRISTSSWSQVLSKVQSKEFVGWIKDVVNRGPNRLNLLSTIKAVVLIRVRAIARRMFVTVANRSTKR